MCFSEPILLSLSLFCKTQQNQTKQTNKNSKAGPLYTKLQGMDIMKYVLGYLRLERIQIYQIVYVFKFKCDIQ